MAQHRKRTYEFPTTLFPDERASMEGALKRIGLPGEIKDWNPLRWEVLDWIVRFADRDLSEMSAGDEQNLREEVRTLSVLLNVDAQPETITLDLLRPFQEQIRAELLAHTEGKDVPFGPFEITFIIRRPGRKEPKLPAGHAGFLRLGKLIVTFQGVRSVHIPPPGLQGLRYHLVRLLGKYPDTVQCCPHCQRLFARFRRHAIYCSRKCQSVAVMRKRRPPRDKNNKAGRVPT